MSNKRVLSSHACIEALRVPGASPAAKERVRAKLSTSLLGLAPAVTDPSGFVGTSDQVTASSSPTVSSLGLRSSVGTLGRESAITLSKRALLLLGSGVFLLGATAGVSGQRLATSRSSVAHQTSGVVAATPPRLNVETVSPGLKATEPLVLSQPPSDKAMVAATEKTQPRSLRPSSSSSSDSVSTLNDERKLLDEARRALARGEPQSGIGVLESHVSRFPNGTLTEEREALYVRILVAQGNDEPAVARANSFQRRFPSSIFMPVIERSLLSIARRKEQGASKE